MPFSTSKQKHKITGKSTKYNLAIHPAKYPIAMDTSRLGSASNAANPTARDA